MANSFDLLDDTAKWETVSRGLIDRADIIHQAIQVLRDEVPERHGPIPELESVEQDLRNRSRLYAINAATGVSVPAY